MLELPNGVMVPTATDFAAIQTWAPLMGQSIDDLLGPKDYPAIGGENLNSYTETGVAVQTSTSNVVSGRNYPPQIVNLNASAGTLYVTRSGDHVVQDYILYANHSQVQPWRFRRVSLDSGSSWHAQGWKNSTNSFTFPTTTSMNLYLGDEGDTARVTSNNTDYVRQGGAWRAVNGVAVFTRESNQTVPSAATIIAWDTTVENGISGLSHAGGVFTATRAMRLRVNSNLTVTGMSAGGAWQYRINIGSTIYHRAQGSAGSTAAQWMGLNKVISLAQGEQFSLRLTAGNGTVAGAVGQQRSMVELEEI